MHIQGLLIATAFVVATGASAQELRPQNYSPTDDIPLKVENIDLSSSFAKAVVTVGNRTQDLRNVRVGCDFYTADGAPIGTGEALAENVPPSGEVLLTVPTLFEGAGRVFCRIVGHRVVEG